VSVGVGPLMWPYAAAWFGPALGSVTSVVLAIRLQSRTAKVLLFASAVLCGLLAGLIFVVEAMSLM